MNQISCISIALASEKATCHND